MDYQELIEWLRCFEIDHSPDGWPAIRMREISAMCDAVESLLAENERLKHNLTSTEQTMREYQALAAERLEEIERMKGQQEPVAFIHTCKSGETLSWFGESSNAASRPDFIKSTPLYTTPQPDRTAELEAALKVAKAGIEWALSNINCEPFEWSDEENADAHREAIETLAKINEVLHD